MAIRLLKYTLLLVVSFAVLTAGSPQSKVIDTETLTFTGVSEQIVTVSGITLDGDSVGFWVDFNTDSVSGYFTYDWATPYGNTSGSSRTMTLSDGSTSFINTGSVKSNYTQSMTRVAGVPTAILYLYITNHKTESSVQTITINIGQVTWR